MFYYISGTISLKSDAFVVLDCGGVGFKVYASTATIEALPQVGSEGKVYTYTNFKASADIFDIYGFATIEA